MCGVGESDDDDEDENEDDGCVQLDLESEDEVAELEDGLLCDCHCAIELCPSCKIWSCAYCGVGCECLCEAEDWDDVPELEGDYDETDLDEDDLPEELESETGEVPKTIPVASGTSSETHAPTYMIAGMSAAGRGEGLPPSPPPPDPIRTPSPVLPSWFFGGPLPDDLPTLEDCSGESLESSVISVPVPDELPTLEDFSDPVAPPEPRPKPRPTKTRPKHQRIVVSPPAPAATGMSREDKWLLLLFVVLVGPLLLGLLIIILRNAF